MRGAEGDEGGVGVEGVEFDLVDGGKEAGGGGEEFGDLCLVSDVRMERMVIDGGLCEFGIWVIWLSFSRPPSCLLGRTGHKANGNNSR